MLNVCGLRTKKNLTGLHITDDASTIVNRIVPTFLNASDAAVLLPETYIDSVRIGDTAVPHVRSIHYGDIKVGEEVDGVVPYPTLASAYSEVRDRGGNRVRCRNRQAGIDC